MQFVITGVGLIILDLVLVVQLFMYRKKEDHDSSN